MYQGEIDSRSQCINDSQFRQMNDEQSKVHMDYAFSTRSSSSKSHIDFLLFYVVFVLSFLCIYKQKNVPFLPIMFCSLGPTIGIARYLSRLLQPIYDQVALRRGQLAVTFVEEGLKSQCSRKK